VIILNIPYSTGLQLLVNCLLTNVLILIVIDNILSIIYIKNHLKNISVIINF